MIFTQNNSHYAVQHHSSKITISDAIESLHAVSLQTYTVSKISRSIGQILAVGRRCMPLYITLVRAVVVVVV